jgi:hypothetical protein
MKPAPLDVRVARVIATPVPFLAYFLIRVPQVTRDGFVPWAEAVPIVILVMAMFPLWLYWCADLATWKRDRPAPAGEPSPLELTADLSDHGTFEGDLRALVDAEAHSRAVPKAIVHQLPVTEESAPWPRRHFVAVSPGWQLAGTDDRPTEPILLTHEFTPASGIAMDVTFADPSADTMSWDEYTAGQNATERDVILSWDPAADGQQVIAVTESGRVYPVDRVDVVKPPRTGRHRAHPIPPPTDENAEPYAQINRTRELPF